MHTLDTADVQEVQFACQINSDDHGRCWHVGKLFLIIGGAAEAVTMSDIVSVLLSLHSDSYYCPL